MDVNSKADAKTGSRSNGTENCKVNVQISALTKYTCPASRLYGTAVESLTVIAAFLQLDVVHMGGKRAQRVSCAPLAYLLTWLNEPPISGCSSRVLIISKGDLFFCLVEECITLAVCSGTQSDQSVGR